MGCGWPPTFICLSGVLDQRRIENRDDVRTFTSPPLENPILAVGPVRARIHPHSGVDPREATELVAVNHTLHSTLEAPSFLELTVLDASAPIHTGNEPLAPGDE